MTDASKESAVRTEVREWLKANWDPSLSLIDWRNLLADSGWGAPHWPEQWYGRGLPPAMTPIVEAEFESIGAVGVTRKGSAGLASLTILSHGTDRHKERFLRRLLTGEDAWCQLFSEPGSGSDLAGATTFAERRGDKWLVNGQKVWTTAAHLADYGILLARTNLDVPKHQGLSYFLINLRQPGVEVRPLKQMNEYASFNEVFFTDAEIPLEDMLGNEGDGWRVATTTLMHERRGANSARRMVKPKDMPGRVYEEEAEEIRIALEPYKWDAQKGGRADLIIERALTTGKLNEPIIRDEIAKLFVLQKSSEWTAKRARAAAEQGYTPGPEGSIRKLTNSMVARAANHVHTLVADGDAMLSGEESVGDGLIAEILISTPAQSIAGGTDEIQKNIISERVLKLPKEPRVDTDRPFREVPKNAAPTR